MRKVVFRDWKLEFWLNQHALNNARAGGGRLGMYHWDSGTFSLYQTMTRPNLVPLPGFFRTLPYGARQRGGERTWKRGCNIPTYNVPLVKEKWDTSVFFGHTHAQCCPLVPLKCFLHKAHFWKAWAIFNFVKREAVGGRPIASFYSHSHYHYHYHYHSVTST